ncbi:efflux RND transporter periplasmic adaptor subunit [Candidatus Berkiella cookevillensis]|uniref:Efflux RND transporter periplasmic adaptor subunit n=1 Tax=Candidatus Berkiella cookevillensis TaxID=437022 RepID=A0A0Q9YMT2_9GAMM|nr:efflux RND transporter periplasmic adaptor subunit [Candidatus Berkiella cookevillensis]MCS5707995.1 efflux RND transporter periplasmic adaptor subunit [Candidatus Berkiella cookevillensis]
MKAKYYILLSIFIIGGASVWLYSSQSSIETNKAQTNQLITVKTIRVQTQDISDEIEALGTTYADEAVNITADVTDTISEISFKDGQFVKKGDVLVRLSQEEELAQKQGIEAQLLEHERELKRLNDLLKRNATAQREFDARKTLVAISKYRLSEINAKIRDRTIRAPFDGILGLRKISVGSLVRPGDVITTLDNISQIKLDFSVPSSYLTVLKEGSTIYATADAFDNKIFRGTVTKISSRVDPSTRSIEIRAILPNPDLSIKPGLLMSIQLLKNKRNAILIPEEAVTQLKSEHFVHVVRDDNHQIERKRITIGVRKPGWVEALSGIEPNANVVIRGFTRIQPDQTVNIEEIPYDHYLKTNSATTPI